MRRLLLLLISSVTVLAQSNAVTATVYGPQQFNRLPGAPVTVRTTFTVPPMVDGPYTIVVQNGTKRANAGRISVNGVRLLDAADFQGATYQTAVTLAGNNRLEVELRGVPGGSITVSIVGYSYEFAPDYASIPLVTMSSSEDIDWRAKGAVTPVKNEGSCHDDWAFSATGAAEGFSQISTGRLVSLSEQELLDCTPPSLSLPPSCADSSPAGALKNVIANLSGQMVSEASYPYTARVGTCKQATAVLTISSLQRSNTEAGLEYQLEQEPVSVVFNGNWLSTYKSGVANPASCGTQPPQYVTGLVVGVIDGGPVPYWIVKLSMGATFGNQGYVDLEKGTNVCGIGNYGLTVH